MSGISGFSNQKKLGKSQYATIQNVGSNRHGLLSPQLYLTEQVPNPIAITDVYLSEDTKIQYIEMVGHQARFGDMIRITSDGVLKTWEFEVVEFVDNDIIGVLNIGTGENGDSDVLIEIGMEAKSYRWVTATSSPDGALTVSPGPVKFVDGAEVTVSPATPLPVVNTLTVKEYSTIDTLVNPIDGSTWVELVSSTIAAIKKIQIFVPSGNALFLGVGASGSEVESAIVAPGGWDIEISLDAGETISLRAVSGVVNDGLIVANLLG